MIDHQTSWAYDSGNMLMLFNCTKSRPTHRCVRSDALHLRRRHAMPSLIGMLLLAMVVDVAVAVAAPLPPARPSELLRDSAESTQAPPEAETAEPQQPSPVPEVETRERQELPRACAALAEAGVIIASAVQDLTIPRPCTLPRPVNLSAVRLDDGRVIAFKPSAIMSCEMVVAMAEWTREDLAPGIDSLGAKLETLKVASSFSCRGRNRQAGARTSEHGFGNAMDVGGFELSDGRTIAVARSGMPQAFALAMKESACARFTTVLGPGSDGYHETHIHVDLAKRRNGFKLCRWKLPGSTTPERTYARAESSTPQPAELPEPQAMSSDTDTPETTMQDSVPLPPAKPKIPARSVPR